MYSTLIWWTAIWPFAEQNFNLVCLYSKSLSKVISQILSVELPDKVPAGCKATTCSLYHKTKTSYINNYKTVQKQLGSNCFTVGHLIMKFSGNDLWCVFERLSFGEIVAVTERLYCMWRNIEAVSIDTDLIGRTVSVWQTGLWSQHWKLIFRWPLQSAKTN